MRKRETAAFGKAAGPRLTPGNKALTCGYVVRSEGLEPPTFRSEAQRSVPDRVATGALGVVHVAVTVAVNAGCSEEAFPRRAQTDAVPGQPGEAPM